MGLVYKNNAPVKFITGTYLGYDAENDRCNCFTRPFCQLVERLDTTDYQVQVTANTTNLVTDPTFDTACGVNWTCGVDWNIAAGVATKVPGVAASSVTQPLCIMRDRYYNVQFTVSIISAGTLTVTLGGQAVGSVTTIGLKSLFILGSAISNTLLSFTDVAGTLNATIDIAVVQELSQIGYEIETQTGTSIFTDISAGVATRFQDEAQITVDWTQASTDDCYVICNHDASDYREQICNGTFDVTDFWVLAGNWVIAAGLLTAPAGSVFGDTATQTFLHPLLAGRCYTLTLDVLGYIGGGVGVNILPLGLIGTISSNGAKSFNIDLTGQPNQTDLEFEILDNNTQLSIDNVSILMQVQCFEEDACSECYKLADTWDCSFLFSWTNDENAFGFEYVGLSFTQFFRHIVKLWQPTYPEDADRFLDSGGTETVLFAQSQKIEELTLQEMPEYLHDSFRLAVIHDTFTIETVNYTKEEGDYEPSWRKSSLLAPVELQVRENGQDNTNENC